MSKSGLQRSAVIVASCGVFRFGGKFRHQCLDIYIYMYLDITFSNPQTEPKYPQLKNQYKKKMSYTKNDVLEKGYEHGESSATLDEDAAVLVCSPAPSIQKEPP